MLVEGDKVFRLTIFYGNPNSSQRVRSWRLLEFLSLDWEGPWLVMGDFNEIFFSWEAKGVMVRDRQRMERFRNCISQCGLFDLGFSGYPFTYSNRRAHPFESRARLDRVFGNIELKQVFPNIQVIHSFGTSSDHVPLLVRDDKRIHEVVDPQLRYESMWHKHEEFPEVAHRAWMKAQEEGGSITDKLGCCANELDQWNKSEFGNVQKRLKEIDKRLKNIREGPRTQTVVSEEQKLCAYRDEWLAREEFLWRQRSRVAWLKEGDRNTAFFHSKASHRRSVNKIQKLNFEGNEYTELPNIIKMTEVLFQRLYSSDQVGEEVDWNSELEVIPRVITEEMAAELLRPCTREEIKSAIFQMAPIKSPDVDGYPALFYLRFWNWIGDSVCSEINEFFCREHLDSRLNEIRITLIPKCKDAKRLEDFRPISVCNTPMKVISKILANRLQVVLPQVWGLGETLALPQWVHHLSDGFQSDVACSATYKVNNYKFHIESHGEGRNTVNSHVYVKGTEGKHYNGVIEEIIHMRCRTNHRLKVVLFKCCWYDP
ncbi:hypothetical protein QQ045_000245 [Rhodiola kirilowii]